MLVLCIGSQSAAKQRLRRARWRDGRLSVGPGEFDAMSKNGAFIAFEPGKGDNGYASLPGTLGFGWQPIPRGNPLYEEAMNCLSGI